MQLLTGLGRQDDIVIKETQSKDLFCCMTSGKSLNSLSLSFLFRKMGGKGNTCIERIEHENTYLVEYLAVIVKKGYVILQ